MSETGVKHGKTSHYHHLTAWYNPQLIVSSGKNGDQWMARGHAPQSAVPRTAGLPVSAAVRPGFGPRLLAALHGDINELLHLDVGRGGLVGFSRAKYAKIIQFLGGLPNFQQIF